MTLSIKTETGKAYKSSDKNISLLLHNLNSKVKKVSVNGQDTAFTTKDNTIEIAIVSKANLNTTIQIQL